MPRDGDRKPVTMQGVMRTARARQDVTVSDLSVRGCKIESLYLRVDIGDKLYLRPQGLEGRPCTVIWCTERAAGIQFDQPFHPAVLDNLWKRHGGAGLGAGSRG